MEVENMFIEGEDDHHTPLPGFRFHPTDEELVGFYLQRKVEKKPIGIELIKQADIYKYDPWDLPKWTNVGEKDKEWYFFCKRGRKYKNSVRPNRVTGSGFWKATGIDKPIYSELENCIGLKKSLVYYRGSAGKGSKTEWMMHEFRLPSSNINDQEAEVWTLCRILRRTSPYKKSAQDWRLVDKKSSTAKSNVVLIDPSSSESSDIIHTGPPSSYISFNNRLYTNNNTDETKSSLYLSSKNEIAFSGQQYFPSFPNYNSNNEFNELLRNADWEDLRSVVDCAHATTTDFSTSMYL